MSEKSLYGTVGDDEVMLGQLDRLLSVVGMPRVALGIVASTAEVVA